MSTSFFKRCIFITFIISVLLFALPTAAQISPESANEEADTPWPMYQHDPQHTGRSPFLGLVGNPMLIWTAQLPDYCSGESGGMAIAKNGNLIISTGGCLHSFNPVNRKVEWTIFGGNSRSIPLVSADDNIYWGYSNSFAQVSLNGTRNWMKQLDPNYVFGSSATFGTDGNLYFVHDGVWSFKTTGDAHWYIPYGSIASHASPAIGLDGTIYAGGGGDICAYSPDYEIIWCADTPGVAGDRTPAIGADGTIYLPTEGQINDGGTGVLVALSPNGPGLSWAFQPTDTNWHGIPDGIAISYDGSIRFGLNTGYTENYLYSLSSNGQFQWKVTFPTNLLTGANPFMRYPITVDRNGNTFICPENSRCYAIDSKGSILWEYQFPLLDSILVTAGLQPIIAADGLFYVVDNQQHLYAFADPSLYPTITTSLQTINQQIEFGTLEITSTIAISSTVAPITYTASISPTVEWLSVFTTTDVTPGELRLSFKAEGLLPGIYQTSVYIFPSEQPGEWLEVPVRLSINNQVPLENPIFIPVMLNNYPNDRRILYVSQWFQELQLASIAQTGKDRHTIANLDSYGQINGLVYSPDGKKLALDLYVDSRPRIAIINTQTGELLLEIVNPGNNARPSWAPDSNRLAFISTRDDAVYGEVYLVNLDGTGLTRLTNNEEISEGNVFWSPKGTQIAIAVGSSRESIYLMNSDGTNFHQLVTNHLNDVPLGWSPDEKRLLLKSQSGTSYSPWQLGICDTDTNAYTFVVEGSFDQVAWSPSGEQIAYIEGLDIYVVDSDGANNLNLTDNFSKDVSEFAWSPDGRWLVLTVKNEDVYPNDHNYDLFVVMPNATNLTQLTTNIKKDLNPFWIP